MSEQTGNVLRTKNFYGAQLLLAAVLAGVMSFETKRASVHLPGVGIAFWRFLVGVLIVVSLFASGLVRPRFRRYDLLAIRGVFGSTAVLCYFTSISHIEVSVAAVLNGTAPVFMAIFGVVFLRERVYWKLVCSILVTGLGIILMVGPRVVSDPSLGWELLALIGAASAAASMTVVRGLRLAGVGPWEATMSFCLVGLVCTIPVVSLNFRWPPAGEFVTLVEIGVLGVTSQWLLSHGLKGVHTAVGGILSQSASVTTMILAAIFFHEPITARTLVGAGLILAAVLPVCVAPVGSRLL